jgi:hypothetical protein
MIIQSIFSTPIEPSMLLLKFMSLDANVRFDFQVQQ